MTFELKSKSFFHNGNIPDRYTCKGEEFSPPLSWDNPPDKTKSYTLIMEDLDTPIMILTHWILYNIPKETTNLPENIANKEQFPNGMVQARNSMRKKEYMSPCPPFGKHRYIFTIYALDVLVEPNPKMNKRKLLKAIEGHILDKSELLGFYSKKS